MHRLIIAAVALAAALPAPAFAQTSVANSMFGWMDRNHDDMLGTAENAWNQFSHISAGGRPFGGGRNSVKGVLS